MQYSFAFRKNCALKKGSKCTCTSYELLSCLESCSCKITFVNSYTGILKGKNTSMEHLFTDLNYLSKYFNEIMYFGVGLYLSFIYKNNDCALLI